MLTALAVTVIVVALLVVAAFLIYRSWKARTGGSSIANKMRVKAISSVGVSAQTPKTSTGVNPVVRNDVGKDGLKNRFLALGALAGGLFAVLAGRLFFLQVLNANQYSQEAEQNLLTKVSTPAPRGVIYDRDGIPLVANKQVQTILADADVANQPNVMLRLSALCGIPYEVVRNSILDATTGAQSQRVVANDVPLVKAAFINEHQDAFPGVTTQIRTKRTYPYGALGAHVLGYVGMASSDDLEQVADGRSLEMGDSVGKSGVEQTYESVLAGDHGQRTLVTNALGDIQQVVSETEPVKGSDIYLTISAPLQYLADNVLRKAVEESRKGTAGSLVLMDVQTGGIVAMASYPTYEPEKFIGGIPQDVWDEYQTESSHYPLLNRAIAGTYPAASCFKAFTGLAGLTYGFADTSKTWNCTGKWTGFGKQFAQKCWKHSGHGHLGLRQGIIDSCDVVFYEIAKDFYNAREQIGDDALQDFLKEFGYNAATGIDLSGESEGRIPTPRWKNEYFRDVPTEAQWLPGDISNMVIGQGYVLVTPIQVARAYAAVATGNLMKPHVLKEIHNSLGEKVVDEQIIVDSSPEVDISHYQVMRDALHAVTTENTHVDGNFNTFSFTAAAKTGTAEVAGKEDFAWFSCYAPYENPKYALTIVIEEGGSGSDYAGVAAKIMSVALKYADGKLKAKVRPVSSERKVKENGSDDDRDLLA